jgi:co-chaperonin GroES (HSP10)
MKSTLYFIVEVKDSYNNYITLNNGLEVMVNNTIDSVEHINRIGKILSSPKGTVASEGDMLLFHHNICRDSWGFKGAKRRSMFLIKDNIYFVPAPEIFMMKKADSDTWEALDPYVFIKPIEAPKHTLANGLEVIQNDYNDMDESVGIVSYVNNSLREQGVKNGDLITFEEYSQHEYTIDGELYYKMQTSDILAIVE